MNELWQMLQHVPLMLPAMQINTGNYNGKSHRYACIGHASIAGLHAALKPPVLCFSLDFCLYCRMSVNQRMYQTGLTGVEA